MKIYKGTNEFSGPARFRIFGNGSFVVSDGDEDGAVSIGGYVGYVVDTDRRITIRADDGVSYHLEVEPFFPFEAADPIPVEVPLDVSLPETLEQKMIRYLGKMIAERYGRDSQEMETFEEYTDFDMEDVEVPSSGYEVEDMAEDVEPLPIRLEPKVDDAGDSPPPTSNSSPESTTSGGEP